MVAYTYNIIYSRDRFKASLGKKVNETPSQPISHQPWAKTPHLKNN
jgi:hypothetical protein